MIIETDDGNTFNTHQPDAPAAFTTITSEEGFIYEPWTDGWAVGFKVTHPTTGQVEYVFLNPSSDSDDGVASVFPYQGPTGDAGGDGGACTHDFALFGGCPVPDEDGSTRYPHIDVNIETWNRQHNAFLVALVGHELTTHNVAPAEVRAFNARAGEITDTDVLVRYCESWVTLRTEDPIKVIRS